MSRRRWILLGAATLALVAGGVLRGVRPPSGGTATGSEVQAQAQADARAEAGELLETLDQLEARLLAGRQTVSLWTELSARHREVSELACSSLELHAQAMAREVAKSAKRSAELKRRRMAAVELARPSSR